MTHFEKLLDALLDADVAFVIVGGYAGVVHGSSLVTQDLDICYERSRANLKRLAKALAPFKPRPRGVPDDLPFVFDERTLEAGMNFTLQTTLGDLDLLGELSGVGGYPQASFGATAALLHGRSCQVASLDVVIQSKRSVGRPKDMYALPELEALRELKSATQERDSRPKRPTLAKKITDK